MGTSRLSKRSTAHAYSSIRNMSSHERAYFARGSQLALEKDKSRLSFIFEQKAVPYKSTSTQQRILAQTQQEPGHTSLFINAAEAGASQRHPATFTQTRSFSTATRSDDPSPQGQQPSGESLFPDWKRSFIPSCPEAGFGDANGKPISISQVVNLRTRRNDAPYRVPFFVVDNLSCPMILGI